MAGMTADTWGMDDEGDLCRVCRSEAEENKPFIYPCKCSGSVRYVHSDCLQEWLLHSRKRYCEICGHHYTFTKVYPSSLPSAIPVIVYVRQSLFVAGRLAWKVFRAWLAIVSWLVILPCVTMCSLRFILFAANYVTFPALSQGIRSVITDSHEQLNASMIEANVTIAANATGRERVIAIIAAGTTLNILPSLKEVMAEDAKNLVAFVFRGLIVAISIAAGLIGLILLREWIGQVDWNQRRVVVEEGDVNPEEWLVRNGVAVRVEELFETLREITDNHTNVQDDAATVVDDHGEDRTDPHPEADLAAHETQPPPRPAGLVAFAAPEELGEGGSSRAALWETSAEAGPSRPTPDVPVDVSGPSTPASPSPWELMETSPSDRTEASQGNSPNADGSGHTSPNGHPYNHPHDSSFPNLDVVTSATGAPEPQDFRRASDPGPAGAEEADPERPWLRPYGSQETTVQAVPEYDAESSQRQPVPRPPQQNPRMSLLLEQDEPQEQAVKPRELTPEEMDVLIETLLHPTDDQPRQWTDAELAHYAREFGIEDLIANRRGGALPPPQDQTTRDPTPQPTEMVRLDTDGDDLDTDADVDIEAEAPEVDMEPDVDNEDEEPHLHVHPEVGAEGAVEAMDMDAMGGVDMPPDDEDDRPLDAEDWDGIFEVIGVIGPLTGLLHNHIFVSFAVACTLTVLVGLPVAIGKTLLATDFFRAAYTMFYSATAAIMLASKLTSMIIVEIGALLRLIFWIPLLPVNVALDVVGVTFNAVGLTNLTGSAVNLSSAFANYTTDFLKATANSTADHPVASHTAVATSLDGLELLGRTAHDLYTKVRLFTVSIAASPDLHDQMVCLVVGYMASLSTAVVMAISDAAELFRLSEGVMDKARSVQIFIKVVFFMGLEIVASPLAVGILIDLCTLPLFGATVQERLSRLAMRPFGTLFVAWLGGTFFMFSIATLVAHMRTICRKGALYFIRDPGDPAHSPIKDIMERPTRLQLLRISMSIGLYGLLVWGCFGAVPITLSVMSYLSGVSTGLLPLRLEQRALSSVPFDLLFLHLVLPPSWDSLRLYHRMKKGLAYWWFVIVRQLDLSNFLFDKDTRRRLARFTGIVDTTNMHHGQAEPQSRASQLTWIVLDAICQALFGAYDNRGTAARVPGNDRIEVPPITVRQQRSMFIPLNERGAPRTAADKLNLLQQDRAARRYGRNPRTDYTVVTLPDFWRTRVHVLFRLALLTMSVVTAAMLFGPLIVGRQVAAMLFDDPVFDGYSWLIGVYICCGSISLGMDTNKRILQYSRARRLRRSDASTRVKRGVFSFLRKAYTAGLLYFVLPLLVGTNFELFVSLPARYGFSDDITPVLHVWDAWAMGTALISLYVGAVGYVLDERHPNGLPNDLPRGLRFCGMFKRPFHPRPFRQLNAFLIPLVLFLLVPIVVPWVTVLGLWAGLSLMGVPLPLSDNSWAFRMMYPISCGIVLAWSSRHTMQRTAERVRQWMIDAEYVVEERVENYEPVEDAATADGDGDEAQSTVGAEAGSDADVANVADLEEEWEDVEQPFEFEVDDIDVPRMLRRADADPNAGRRAEVRGV